MKTFCFDMDGTIADFYGVPNWLQYLEKQSVYPYEVAAPLVNLSNLARMLNRIQRSGNKLVIISWCSRKSNIKFDMAIEAAKRRWLCQHLPSVEWDEILIVPYGHNKADVCSVKNGNYILFDDEEQNRKCWCSMGGQAFSPNEIFQVLGRQ